MNSRQEPTGNPALAGGSLPTFMAVGGEMGSLMRAYEWAKTPVGEPATWPQPLRTVIRLILNTKHPMFVFWGPALTCFYNDAFRSSLGPEMHPGSLGSPGREVWSEVWSTIGPQIDQVMTGGDATWHEDHLVPIQRHGGSEEAYWTYSYSPIDQEAANSGVGGVLVVCTETTARVLAERRQRTAIERQRKQFEQAPGFICIMQGPEHVFEFVNATHRRLFASSGWIGKTVREAFPDIAGQGFYELLDQVYRSAEKVVISGACIRYRLTPEAPIEERFLDFIYAPIIDDSGVTGIFCEGHDVTESHLAQMQLRESEARLRELNAELERKVIERAQARGRTWQVSPDLLGALNVEGFFETSNPAWMTVLGWTEEEVASMSIFEMLHPDDLQRTREGFGLTQQGQAVIRFRNRYRHKDGSYRWISWVGVPEDGMVYCNGRDVSAEVEQATELAERTAERDRLWRNSQDLLVVIDGQGVFQAVSPVSTSILGWTPEEMIGRTVFSFIHPEDQSPTQGALHHATEKALPSYENRYRHKDGSYRWLSWVAAPEGGLIYATARHITAEKEQQLALRQAEEQLRQAQKMEAVGQLTGGLAHDFNNLLTGISGSLELLSTRLSQGRTGDVDRLVGTAQGAAKRAASLTHRLLAFSRRQTLDPKPTNVNRLVIGMEELIRRTVGPAIAIEVAEAGGLWSTQIDPSQLENALLNLCINSRDAMPDGGRLTIETANKWLDHHAARERDLPPGQYVSLCVSDTGAGMTPEVIRRAFDPFYTTKPLGVGTGLGLSMVYGFARQSGGQVRIYSEKGQGTTVCLYLPRHVAAEDGTALIAEPGDLRPSEQGETVLVVDDEPTVRLLVTEILNDLGYVVREAGDGRSAFDIIRSDAELDLLITDVGLPNGMNGRQLADLARSTRPNLKILFITGYAENAVIGNGHLEPGMHVLTKPFTLEALATRIKELLAA